MSGAGVEMATDDPLRVIYAGPRPGTLPEEVRVMDADP